MKKKVLYTTLGHHESQGSKEKYSGETLKTQHLLQGKDSARPNIYNHWHLSY